ncbi:transcriptional initiation protein Tat [Roseomonas indoligenes]|uniref:Transcriptional initiation protein Tat n=1 Tax=Roseomonas indoligenes TaxID=2820811 RepID=A0A940MZL7_9PROT|nr:transcriptional initiation protein Tat [Pararoseomonas indoligenes]MBP0495111.1 transcriptional initiation protein Tat [Pararoseomonas indoligenes]
MNLSRRLALLGIGGAAALSAGAPAARAGSGGPALAALAALSRRLAAAPRRRGFAAVPLVVDRPDLWDHEASAILLDYPGGPKQVWECSDIAAAWPNLMREALNGQVFAHSHPDFLAVAAVHGTAHLALFSQVMWDKYGLAANTRGSLSRNEMIVERPGASPEDDLQSLDGFYGPGNNNIVSLQRRGAVFVACHDSIHAIARGIRAARGAEAGAADAIAAELTNNLVSGTVLVPSVVAYLAEVQRAGFTYAKAS